MTAPLSQDLRERIAHAVGAGSSARAAAERFAVSPSAAIKLMQRVRETGSTAREVGGRGHFGCEGQGSRQRPESRRKVHRRGRV